MRQVATAFICLSSLLGISRAIVADEALAKALRELDTRVYREQDEQKQLAEMLGTDLRKRRKETQERESAGWAKVKSKEDWERFRDERLEKLRQSVGYVRASDTKVNERVTGTFRGEGYEIENLIFESRGLLVTANLYKPAEPRESMPGILLCHSHHAPKTQGELQDMGISWAKQGCLVLVMDQLGHGERRQHAFKTAADYPGEFRPSRQDYFFRYNSGMQLHLMGQTLIGWMASDPSRGVELLLERQGVDPKRIILLGAVAGGGDPAAVTAALDERITGVVPFNFGGPQPETTYPLPPNAEQTFNYFGGGSWESTRNITGSISGGYAPWVIVGAAAPRKLVYAHEFTWDQEHDPVRKRLQTIYGFYDAQDSLSSTHGEGSVRGSGAGNTHCTNIGPVHRVAIDAAFEKWFNIAKPSHDEQPHRKWEELACLKPEVKVTPLHEVAAELGRAQAEKVREMTASFEPELRALFLHLNSPIIFGKRQTITEASIHKRLASQTEQDIVIERLGLEVEKGILVPLVVLRPATAEKSPLVVAVSQHGKSVFLKERAGEISELLASGVAVCLPDVRGTGESSPDDGRGRNSSLTSYSSSHLMFGQPLLADRVDDLGAVLRVLRGHPNVDRSRIALWGDSFAPVNPPGKNLAAPLDAADSPHLSEPLGGLLVVLTAIRERETGLRGVYSRGGLVSFQSLLESPYVYAPHDVIFPGILAAGDLPLIADSLAPIKVRLVRQVDGQNRLVKPNEPDESPAAWLKEDLK